MSQYHTACDAYICPCLLREYRPVPLFLPQKKHLCIFSLHGFFSYFAAPLENRWKICIICIHKRHNLLLLHLGHTALWDRFAHHFFVTIIVPHCFSVQKNWICPYNFLQLTVLMVLLEDNKTLQWLSSIFIKTISQSDLHSSTITSRNRKHNITFWMREKRCLSFKRPSK